MASMRCFFRFIKNALLVLAGVVLLIGFVAYSQGAVTLYVHEKGPEGKRLLLPVPALVVSEGLRLVPAEDLHDALRQAGPWLPAIQVAAAELGNAPDSLLVEVRDNGDHVVIRKRGNYLLVEVESDEDTVRVAVPLSTVRAVAQSLEHSRDAGNGADAI